MRTVMVWLAVSLLCVLGMGFSCWSDCRCVDDDCYEDVIVSGAGYSRTNGTYFFTGMINEYPVFEKIIPYGFMGWGSDRWRLLDPLYRYTCDSTSTVPPATGWYTDPDGQDPAPMISGGEECSPPVISGTPDLEVTGRYVFVPIVEGGHAPLIFSVTNLPSWASFNKTTGKLSGAPSPRHSGEYVGVSITVQDQHGRTSTSEPFTLTVPSSLEVTPLGESEGFLNRAPSYDPWQPIAHSFQVQRTDGTPAHGLPLHVYVFSVDASTEPVTRSLIEHRVYAFNSVTGSYEYTIPACAVLGNGYEVVFAFSSAPYIPPEVLPSTTGGSSANGAGEPAQVDAVYEIGELVTGRCLIRDAGTPSVSSFIHVYLNAAEVDARPVTATLLDHWVIRCSAEPGVYCLEIETTDLNPGDYLIHLVFEDGSTEDLTIQLVAPAT